MNNDEEKVERTEMEMERSRSSKRQPPGWSADKGAWRDVIESIGDWQTVTTRKSTLAVLEAVGLPDTVPKVKTGSQ
jgi:hypothetical protein